MKHFSFISDNINQKLGEFGVRVFSLKWNKRDIVQHDGDTMSVKSTFTDKLTHLHAHGHSP